MNCPSLRLQLQGTKHKDRKQTATPPETEQLAARVSSVTPGSKVQAEGGRYAWGQVPCRATDFTPGCTPVISAWALHTCETFMDPGSTDFTQSEAICLCDQVPARRLTSSYLQMKMPSLGAGSGPRVPASLGKSDSMLGGNLQV